jgi:hypothetical protein
MRRRTFLASSVAVGASFTSGCTGLLAEEREGVTLTHVELGNASNEPQVFDLLVTHDDEIIHWSSHEVGVGGTDQEMGDALVELDSPDERGHVEVLVRVGEEWERTDFDTDRYDGERVIAVVVYGIIEDDMLRISRLVSDRPTADE